MNRARRKKHKRGTTKRLVRESLLLSCTRFLSSRFVRFFESGFASSLINSVKTVDNFVRDKITGPIFKRLGVRKNFSMPARNGIAAFISRSPVMKTVAALRASFLNTSLRTAGIFLLTFGVYAASIFLLKRYVSLDLGAEAAVDDISAAAIISLIGLLLTAFGDKSIVNALGNSRIMGALLSNSLGVNDSSLDRYSSVSSGTSVGFGFLFGSLFGVATLFFAPVAVLLFILSVFTILAIFHIPEFGLLLTVSAFTFVPSWFLAVTVALTVVSFLVKCIRLKRNFRFGTADAAVLLTFIALSVAFGVSNGGINSGEWFILCFTAVYFPAKNLLCSEKLIYQTFNALCLGASLGMALYILGDFAELIPHDHFRNLAYSLSEYTLAPDMMAMTVIALLPFALSSYSPRSNRNPRGIFLLVTLACAVVMDSLLFYLMLIISLLVYVACVYKAPVGALAAGGIIFPPVISIASDRVLSTAASLGAKTLYDPALSILTEAEFANFWSGFYHLGGIIPFAFIVLAFPLVFQRIFAAVNGSYGNRVALYGGTIASSAVMCIVCMCIFDQFSDLRMILPIWFIFGLCGAYYSISVKLKNKDQEA